MRGNGLIWCRRSHSSSRQEAAQLRSRDRQQRLHQRSEQSTARGCTTCGSCADSKEVATTGRQRGQVRRQRLRPDKQGWRAHWFKSQRGGSSRAEAKAMVEDTVACAHARLKEAKVPRYRIHSLELVSHMQVVEFLVFPAYLIPRCKMEADVLALLKPLVREHGLYWN